MLDSILCFLKTVNDHYSQLLLVVIAVVSAGVAYREYLLRRRPYVLPELVFDKEDDNWYFHLMLVNKGEYPAIIKISIADLRIGDELYPTKFPSEVILSPGEKQRLAPLGHINKIGRDRIIGRVYKINRVEIHASIKSKALGQKMFKYKTEVEYEVDVDGQNPVIKLVKEQMS